MTVLHLWVTPTWAGLLVLIGAAGGAYLYGCWVGLRASYAKGYEAGKLAAAQWLLEN